MGEGAPRISDAEWDVMEVVRERGTVTPADVIDRGARARGWGWLAAGLLLALAVSGMTDAALLIPAGGPPAATIAMTEQAEGKPRQAADAAPGRAGAESKAAAEPVPKPIADAIAVLRKTQIREPQRWGSAIRTLAQIGRLAVPYLIDELDRTTEAGELQSLAFTLRAIGDPRAVPALIRAIPRTLVNNAGDNGLTVFNPALLEFLQRHDTDPGVHASMFAFGTPYHEISGALHSITGQRFNEEAELHFVGLEGSPRQRWLKRRLFQELAAHWAVWWKKNWQRFTDDPAYARVSVPPLPEAPQVAAAAADQPFPTGNGLKVSNGPMNAIVGPPQPQDYYRTFKDLDTGRELPWPAELPDVSKVKGDDIAAFAAREGLDLRGTEYTPPGSSRCYYAIQGLGLRAWQIDNSRYFTIEDELRDGRPPKLDRPAGELLADFDPKTGVYHPENKATFLFVTRDGTTGALQLNGLVTGLPGPDEVRMRFRPPDPPEDPGKPTRLKSVHGAYRGVQFTYKFLYTEENEVW